MKDERVPGALPNGADFDSKEIEHWRRNQEPMPPDTDHGNHRRWYRDGPQTFSAQKNS